MLLDLGGATLETRKVPHGSFTQGAGASEAGHEKDEEPAHHVTITKDFWIGKYPVTRGQFAKFVADTRYVSQSGGAGWAGKNVADGGTGPVLVQRKDFTWRSPGFTQTDEHPVVLVSYGDANAFVGWASRKSGKRVRLPTESEWELAARAGTTTPWSGGPGAESDPASYGWFKPNAGNGTRPVGQKKANPLGIFDMSGNVMEWCRDVYAPYREGALVDPEVTTNTSSEPERRVLRGGSWFRDPKRGRSAARYKNTPGSRNADNGFRVVVTNEELVVPGVSGPGPDFVPQSPLGATGTSTATPVPTSSAGSPVSGPQADGEPVRTGPVGHPGDAFSWGLLLASPVAASSAVVAWMLLRRKRKPGARPETARVPVPASASGPARLERPTGTPNAGLAPPSSRRPPPVPPRAPPPVPQSSRSVTAPLPPPPPPPSRPASERPPAMRQELDSVIIEAASSEPILAEAPIEESMPRDEAAAAAAAPAPAPTNSEALAAADTIANDALTSQQALEAAATADAASEANRAAKPSDEVAKTSEDVAKPSEDVAKPSEDVAKPSEEIAKPSEEPAKASDEHAKASDEPAKASDEHAKASEEHAKASEEPAKAIEEPAKAIEEPAKAIEEPAKAIEEPAKAIEEPAKASDDDVAKPSEDASEASKPESTSIEGPARSVEELAKASDKLAEPSDAPAKPAKGDAKPVEPNDPDESPSSKPPVAS
jgi:formylglycine-generating enzyme required for sulfatase activity/methyl-accepting chemotaxis protein